MTLIRRPVLLLLVFLLVAGCVAGDSLHRPPSAMAIGIPIPPIPGIGDLCKHLPDGAAQKICDGVTNPVGTAGAAIGSIPGVPDPVKIIGDAVNSAENAAVELFAREVARGEAAALNFVLQEEFKIVNDATIPDITNVAFTTPLELVFGMSLMLALGGLAWAVGKAARKQDPTLISDGAIRFVTFFLGVSILPNLLAVALKVCDGELAPQWLNLGGNNVQQAIQNIGSNANGGVAATVSLGEIFVFGPLLAGAVFMGVLFFLLFAMRYFGIPIVLAGLIVSLGLRPAGDEADAGRSASLAWKLVGLVLYKIVVGGLLFFGSVVLVHGAITLDIWPILGGTTMEIMLPVLSIAAWRWITNHDFQPINTSRQVHGAAMMAYRRFAPVTAAA